MNEETTMTEILSADELMHFGVKGMKWGVRRAAKKDAKEYSRSKMYYGKGAGVRRREINRIVNERSKDATYKAEFDKALSKRDAAKDRKSAHAQRRRNDTIVPVAKAAGRAARSAAKGAAAVTATAAVGGGLALANSYLKDPDGTKQAVHNMIKKAKPLLNYHKSTIQRGARMAANFLKKMR